MEKLQPKNTGDNLRPFSLLERLQKDKAEASTPAQKIIVSNSQRWVMQLDIMKKHIHNILMKNNMKGWNCMIPNSSYPLSREEMEKVHQYSSLEFTNMVKHQFPLTNHIRPIPALFLLPCPQE